MLDCTQTQDSLLAPLWILESTPLLSCAVGDKIGAPPLQRPNPASGGGMKSGGGVGLSGAAVGGGKLSVDDDDSDMFGTSRNSSSSSYSTTTFCRVQGARPTMISAKYRQKEERRKVLKISISKLKKIEDPESSLRRSVLINNTMKRLQREAREEKFQKQQAVSSGFSRCFGSDFFKDDENIIDQMTSVQSSRSSDQLVDITNLPEINNVKTSTSMMGKPLTTTTTSTTVVTSMCLEDCLGCDETMPDVTDAVLSSVTTSSCDSSPASRGAGGRKRSFDDVDESDVQDVLSQFYMPPTPRMLTSIDDDEDEDVNVVDLDAPPLTEKRPRIDCEQSAADRLKNMTRCQSISTTCSDIEQRLTMSTSGSDVISERSATSGASFSCGHSSMFNELQSVVYHSLIASLET